MLVAFPVGRPVILLHRLGVAVALELAGCLVGRGQQTARARVLRQLLDADAALGVRRVIGEALAARLVRRRVVDEELAGRAGAHRVVLVALAIRVEVVGPALLALARGESRFGVQVEQLANRTRAFCAIRESASSYDEGRKKEFSPCLHCL